MFSKKELKEIITEFSQNHEYYQFEVYSGIYTEFKLSENVKLVFFEAWSPSNNELYLVKSFTEDINYHYDSENTVVGGQISECNPPSIYPYLKIDKVLPEGDKISFEIEEGYPEIDFYIKQVEESGLFKNLEKKDKRYTADYEHVSSLWLCIEDYLDNPRFLDYFKQNKFLVSQENQHKIQFMDLELEMI